MINPVPVLNSRLYDALKYLAQVVLPALGTLYFALGDIWGLPKVGEVVGSVTAIDAFLGVLLKLSSNTYDNSGAKYDGEIHVAGDKVQMSSDDIGEAVAQGKKEVTLRVKKVAPAKKAPRKRPTKKATHEADSPEGP